ncbi:hypothetical protein D1007_11938 [Hordeum vulgare]|nr:hypothetical protein D1007_11938 [Hordeum vulgare]
MEEKAVQNLVERIRESIVWGPEQEVSLPRFDNWKGCYVRIEDGEDMVAEIDRQEGWTSKASTFYAELIDLKCDSKVGYVQSKMASQMVDAEWVAQKQMLLPMISELIVIGEERRDDADEEEGHNVDVTDKEKDDTSVRAAANRNSNPQDDGDILKHMMEMGADDVDDTDDNELVNLYDKENPVIEVAKLWPNMDEFRMCFKTYAVNHEFEAKTLWIDRKKLYARCEGYDGGANPCKWYISARRQPDGSIIRCCPQAVAVRRNSGAARKPSPPEELRRRLQAVAVRRAPAPIEELRHRPQVVAVARLRRRRGSLHSPTASIIADLLRPRSSG